MAAGRDEENDEAETDCLQRLTHTCSDCLSFARRTGVLFQRPQYAVTKVEAGIRHWDEEGWSEPRRRPGIAAMLVEVCRRAALGVRCMDQRPVGFLDSGVGGLGLMKAARRLLPSEHFLMLADGRCFPYGERRPAEVCDRVERLSAFLLEQGAKLIVIACNTASVHALAHARRCFPDVPFVGVVPVVKTLARRTRTGTIAVLATPATARSEYLAGLIAEFAPGLRVINVGAPGLAEAVEAGDAGSPRVRGLLEQCLADVRTSEADVLGLACTHYLFLRRPIKQILGSRVLVFDPARPVARRVRQVLAERDMLACGTPESDLLFSTGDAVRFARVARRLLRRPEFQVLPVDV
jgi:glutamate racemase